MHNMTHCATRVVFRESASPSPANLRNDGRFGRARMLKGKVRPTLRCRPSRRPRMKEGSLACGGAAATLCLNFGLSDSGVAGETSLGAAAAATGRYFGAALDPGDFDEKPYRELAVSQLTCVTPE